MSKRGSQLASYGIETHQEDPGRFASQRRPKPPADQSDRCDAENYSGKDNLQGNGRDLKEIRKPVHHQNAESSRETEFVQPSTQTVVLRVHENGGRKRTRECPDQQSWNIHVREGSA